jgi:pilus assembly protein CpaE
MPSSLPSPGHQELADRPPAATFHLPSAYPILLVGPDSEVGTAMLRRLRNREEVDVCPSLDELSSCLGPEPHIVILGTELDTDDALEATLRLASERLDVGTVLLVEEFDADLLQRALRAGVSDVLHPGQIEELDDAIERIGARLDSLPPSERTTPEGPGRQLIAVVSAKGGVGKTVVSTNLALALAHQGLRTALVDTDFEFGDVAVMLKVTPTTNLSQLAEHMELLDDAFEGDKLSFSQQPLLKVLPAPLDPLTTNPLDSEAVTRALTRIRNRHADITVVDTPPQLGARNLELLELADQVIFVTQADLANAKAVKIALPGLEAIGLDLHGLHLVMNRSQSKARLDEARVAQSIGIQASCNLPSTVLVPRSINQGLPLVLSNRRSEFAREIEALARQVSAHVPERL